MSDYRQLTNKKQQAHDNLSNGLNELNKISEECDRVAKLASNAHLIIGDIDKQFEAATKLTGVDKKFLFTAVALQCIRQYVIGSIMQRKPHDESDEAAHRIQDFVFKNKEKNKMTDNEQRNLLKKYRANGARYRATKEEIIFTTSVPYGVTYNTKMYGVAGVDGNGAGIGLSGTNYRYKSLGHDPLLDWVFGTSNIMTNTLTNNFFIHICKK